METSKNYFYKMNDQPVPLVPVISGDDVLETDLYFVYRARKYYISDFIRTHNNPWFSDDSIPENIHGFNSDYYDPIYITISDDVETVDIWRKIEAKSETQKRKVGVENG